MKTENMVYCQKYGKELPSLEEAPLKGAIGQLILSHVSNAAWQDWVEAQIKIINEERLDLSDQNAQQRLFDQMIEYLKLRDFINS